MAVRNKLVTFLFSRMYGRGSGVSVPSQGVPPLLKSDYPAGLDDLLAFLAEELSEQRGDKPIIHWAFLVGGPGNGKSEAIRDLASKLGILLPERSSNGPTTRSLPDSWPSSALQLESGKELLVINDASIERRLGDQRRGGSLFNDLQDALEMVASGRHLNLFANVNRGVLVEELSLASKDIDGTGSRGPIAREVIDCASGLRRDMTTGEEPSAVQELRPGSGFYQQFEVSSFGESVIRVHLLHLDQLSLIEPAPGYREGATIAFGEDEAKPAKFRPVGKLDDADKTRLHHSAAGKLLRQATSGEMWAGGNCIDPGSGEPCPALQYCPFVSNAQWLADDVLAERFLDLLRCFEVTAGWRMTYRELLAELGNAVLGPISSNWVRHQENGDTGASEGHHPCDWVRERAPSGDSVQPSDPLAFPLRRVYANVFSELERLKEQFKGFSAGPGQEAARDIVSQITESYSGRSPRIETTARAFSPTRDPSPWPPAQSATGDLRAAALGTIEAMHIDNAETPAQWATSRLGAASTSALEGLLDNWLVDFVQELLANAEKRDAELALLLRKARASLLLSQTALAAGKVKDFPVLSDYLKTQKSILSGKKTGHAFTKGIESLILGPLGETSRVKALSQRAGLYEEASQKADVYIEIDRNETRISVDCENDTISMSILSSGNTILELPVSYELFLEALMNTPGTSGFSDLDEMQLSRIERARARMISRSEVTARPFVVVTRNGDHLRIEATADGEKLEVSRE